MSEQPVILAIDPGTQKVGLACLYLDGTLVDKLIVGIDQLHLMIEKISKEQHLIALICGNGTNHHKLFEEIRKKFCHGCIAVYLVDEAYSTEEARKKYWICEPPSGWRRMIPTSFLYPPCLVDDYTAWIIGERFLSSENGQKLIDSVERSDVNMKEM